MRKLLKCVNIGINWLRPMTLLVCILSLEEVKITNILKDGIETPFVHNTKITISWGGDIYCDLSIVDYWFNLFIWSMVLKTHKPIEPKHIFWQKDFRKNNLKQFVDDFILTKENRINIDTKELNSLICDGLYKFSEIEKFSYYLANTINNEDDIDLMNANQEFYDLLHCSLQGVPFDNVKEAGMNEHIAKPVDTKLLVKIIRELADK